MTASGMIFVEVSSGDFGEEEGDEEGEEVGEEVGEGVSMAVEGGIGSL